MLRQQELKQQAATAALDYRRRGRRAGCRHRCRHRFDRRLFIDGLAGSRAACAARWPVRNAARARLAALGIPVLDLNEVGHMPMYVDGADDEIDGRLHMIKGGGGAARDPRENRGLGRRPLSICIADESKLVERYWARFRCRSR